MSVFSFRFVSSVSLRREFPLTSRCDVKLWRFSAQATSKTRRVLRRSISEDKEVKGVEPTVARTTSQSSPVSLPFISVMAAAAVGVAVASQNGSIAALTENIQDLIANAGALGPVIFIAAYVAATVLLVPGSVLTLAAGYLYGPALGTALVSVSSTLGAAAAFLVSRYLARPWVERKLTDFPKFKAIDRAVAEDGTWIVLLLRLSPLFPFALLNYALGLTKVDFWAAVLASWVGMLPGTFAYVYLGTVGRAAVDTASGDATFDATRIALYSVGAVATLLATRLISKAASRALQRVEEEDAQQQQTESPRADEDVAGGAVASRARESPGNDDRAPLLGPRSRD